MNEPRIDAFLQGIVGNRPIRWKLAFGFGALLALGVINIAVYYWGAHRRAKAWEEVQRAIERQTIIMEVQNSLSNQKKYVDLLAGVIGVQDQAAPGEIDEEQFATGVDTIAVRLLEMSALADPERRADLHALHEKTSRLADSWKRFYSFQWTEPSSAIEELYVTAEPLAEELLFRDLPQAVQYEKTAMATISAQYVRTEQWFGQLAWVSFLVSALLGGALAVYVSRDLLRSISALRTGTERIGRGDLDHRIAVRSRDELGQVAGSFNEMSDRLKARTDELAAQRDQIEAQRDDLTHTLENLRTTQAQLVQQEKLASLGALTAGIAHEIKNPLNFINNFAALCEELVEELREELGDRAGDERDGEENVSSILQDLQLNANKIKEHGRRADAIVKSMLLHSRGKAGEWQEVDVNALVDEYLTLAYHGMKAQRADFDVQIDRNYGNVSHLQVVPQELGRVFINLLNNAFYAVQEKASRENHEAYRPRVEVGTEHRKGGIAIHISDNGGGVANDVIDRIFEPFFTTKPTGEGTGLGLSLSYEIVTQLHGGTMDISSEPGEGTRFTLLLPASNESGSNRNRSA